MKLFIGLLSLVFSLASFASNGETRTFIFDGSQNSIELILRGEKTHTEYRYEQRASTCFRTEIVGYRTICTGGGYPFPGQFPGPGPRPFPGPGPRPFPGGGCFQEPIYRQVAYPCTETVKIPFEVKDYDVDARVLLDVKNLSEGLTPAEKFVVTLHGDNLSVQTVGSKKFFIVLKKQDLRENISGSVKFMDAFYSIELMEALSVFNALKMESLSVTDGLLKIKLGEIKKNSHIGFSLNVAKKRLGKDKVIFDRELDATELLVSSLGDSSSVEVNLEKIGVNLEKGKYVFNVKAFFQSPGVLMNRSQFGEEFESSKTFVLKNR